MANFIVVAASSGIGQATAQLLKEAGHTVFQTARNENKIKPNLIVDACDFAAMDGMFEHAQKEIGKIDGIVNCAGSLLLRSAHLTDQKQFNDTIQANLATAFATVRAAGKHMKEGGSVVLISSAAAEIGLANHEAIAAAKAGINGLVRAAAASYAHQDLRFNAVAPGLTDTPLTKALTNSIQNRKISEDMHPLGRLGCPDDIARAILFLLDPQNNWITGQILGVDGGLGAVRAKIKATP